MTRIVKVKKTGDESNANLLRRFSKQIRGSGIIRHLKENRYSTRNESSFKKKKNALNRLAKRAEYQRLYKLGKIGNVFSRKF